MSRILTKLLWCIQDEPTYICTWIQPSPHKYSGFVEGTLARTHLNFLCSQWHDDAFHKLLKQLPHPNSLSVTSCPPDNISYQCHHKLSERLGNSQSQMSCKIAAHAIVFNISYKLHGRRVLLLSSSPTTVKLLYKDHTYTYEKWSLLTCGCLTPTYMAEFSRQNL